MGGSPSELNKMPSGLFDRAVFLIQAGVKNDIKESRLTLF